MESLILVSAMARTGHAVSCRGPWLAPSLRHLAEGLKGKLDLIDGVGWDGMGCVAASREG